jgi:glucokinase
MYLALDIGGTKTQGALFTDGGILLEDSLRIRPTRTFDGENAVYENVLDLAKEVSAAKDGAISAVGLGCPGPLDRRRGLIVHAPLMGWRNFPLAERLSADLALPVSIDKDTNLGALAETRLGVAKGLQNAVYITVSTGIGGGIVLNGEIHHGKNDGAGEVGHLPLDPDGLSCPCGSSGCFEMYASGTALLRQMTEDRDAGKKSLIFDIAHERDAPLSGKLLDEAAAAGDSYALALYRDEGFYLGAGLAAVFNLLDPEAVILGGGVTKGRVFFHVPMMETLQKRCIHPLTDGAVRYSEMNDRVVLYGAYLMIKDATSAR